MKNLNLGYTENHDAWMNRLMAERGYISRQEVLRAALKLLYEKEFKPYIEAITSRRRNSGGSVPGMKDDEDRVKLIAKANDPDAYCREVLKGEPAEVDGQLFCVIANESGFEEYIPMPTTTI